MVSFLNAEVGVRVSPFLQMKVEGFRKTRQTYLVPCTFLLTPVDRSWVGLVRNLLIILSDLIPSLLGSAVDYSVILGGFYSLVLHLPCSHTTIFDTSIVCLLLL